MVHEYFSDRENGVVERNSEEISADVWDGVFSIYQSLIKSNKLSGGFSEECPDGQGVCGCDESQLERAIKAQIPKLHMPIQASEVDIQYSFSSDENTTEKIFPEKYTILDFIEFLHKYIQDPEPVGSYHEFYNHNHYKFTDNGIAKDTFISDINTIFERNGVIFYLDTDGKIKRNISAPLQEQIDETKHWLNNYPNSLSHYLEAIEKYKSGKYPRNLLDDLRLSLESLLKDLFTNSASLENQISHVGRFIKSKGGSKELSNMFKKLLDYYASYQNNYVKHSSDVLINEQEVEFIIELTSSFMKHLIKLKD